MSKWGASEKDKHTAWVFALEADTSVGPPAFLLGGISAHGLRNWVFGCLCAVSKVLCVDSSVGDAKYFVPARLSYRNDHEVIRLELLPFIN